MVVPALVVRHCVVDVGVVGRVEDGLGECVDGRGSSPASRLNIAPVCEPHGEVTECMGEQNGGLRRGIVYVGRMFRGRMICNAAGG